VFDVFFLGTYVMPSLLQFGVGQKSTHSLEGGILEENAFSVIKVRMNNRTPGSYPAAQSGLHSSESDSIGFFRVSFQLWEGPTDRLNIGSSMPRSGELEKVRLANHR